MALNKLNHNYTDPLSVSSLIVSGNLVVGGSAGTITANSFIPTSSTIPVNGNFLPATNSVGIATNSTERMRIDNAGNVGIGTSSPQVNLHTVGKGSFGDAVTTATSTRALNLISSDAVMQVRRHSATGAPAIELKGYDATGLTLTSWWDMYSGAPSNGDMFAIRQRTVSDINRLMIDSNGAVSINSTAAVWSSGYGALTLDGTNGVLFSLKVNGTETFRIQPTSISTTINGIANVPILFNTNNTERMRIDNAGNVGINVATPASFGKLAVNGGGLVVLTTGNDTEVPIAITANGTGAAYFAGMYSQNNYSVSAATFLTFKTTTTAGVVGERVRIDAAGLVGIGATPSGAMFTVVNNTAGNVGTIIKGAASQTGDLLQIQNNAGTPLAKIDYLGNLTATKFVTTSGTSSQFVKGDGSLDSTTYSPLAENINTTAKTAGYTIATTDYGTTLQMNGAFAFTVSTALSAAPVGTKINLLALTTGVSVAASGVTIYYTPGLKLRSQYSAASLVCLASNVWLLTGDLSA